MRVSIHNAHVRHPPDLLISPAAVTFGKYGDRQFSQRPLQVPLGDVRAEPPGLDAVDSLAGSGPVPGRHVESSVLCQLSPPFGVLATGGVHAPGQDCPVPVDLGHRDHH